MESIRAGPRSDSSLSHTAGHPETAVVGRPLGGFSFDLARRNALLIKRGMKLPRAMKTGTTIVGVVYKDGIVLGADTRATEGTVVADLNCQKIHYLADNIYCCGAGTAADTEKITELTASNLELLRLQTHRQPRVVSAMTMLKRRLFQYQGHISAALVLGGVDATGPHLYSVYPHGSTDKLPFVTMGSGSLAAMAVFESGYKDEMSEDEAKDLVRRAIRAGIFNDLGSGSNVDLCVIRAGGKAEVMRGYEKPNPKEPLRALTRRPESRSIPAGSTKVVKTMFERFVTVSDTPPAGAAAGGGSM